ncbi:LON peptidase substrate-binding domain-containing protein [Prosthecobacter sp.]|uniref:LON peptidase substrate-binding domain-containing protein n=1 Tax=Prosthecobacter sp. TaxID=1965333 RepID=UPI002AB82E52|nr:LON peptidase substrate-binding domain-containing protein [Prosthecobacter sp.]MDZ4405895.1 LON peptidase substrate-binding domain-containing protein [Prosthecobacter sp.]
MDISSKTFSARQFVLPRTLPMIVLDGCYLFPGCHLPLFIFEERYRRMLDHALHTDRMFCIGAPCGADDVQPVTTAGLIRASVKNADGTSQVMLYGVTRVRITGWDQMLPFRIARVESILTKTAPLETLRTLKSKALALLPYPTDDSCENMQLLRQSLEEMDETETVCDIIAFHFVRRKAALRALLAECCPQRRYERLIAELEKEQD